MSTIDRVGQSQERIGMTTADPGTDPFLSPPLDGEQLALLRRYGQERPTRVGQVLFREGDWAYDFIVVLSGAVTVVDHDAGVVRELATLGPGRFVAELNILTGGRVFATAVVREPGSVLVVPVDRLKEVIAKDQQLADVIVQVILRRRQWFVQHRAGLQILGSRTSPDARRLREFAAYNRLPHVWVDLDTDPTADAVLAHHGLVPSDAPVVLMRGGEVLRNPSNGELARAAGLGTAAVADEDLRQPRGVHARRHSALQRAHVSPASTGGEESVRRRRHRDRLFRRTRNRAGRQTVREHLCVVPHDA
ncbi:MAG TPA: cyclic nucleotide-binding domain-containing protein [Vicinamibacterales bacterium]|nr:cyclic nucleotide-binding domain-containing protein [Vicinamibacterales bacterium]